MTYFIHINLFKKICKNLHKEIKKHNPDIKLTTIHHEVSRSFGYYNYLSYLKTINKRIDLKDNFYKDKHLYPMLLCAAQNILSPANPNKMELNLIIHRSIQFIPNNKSKRKMNRINFYKGFNKNIDALHKKILSNRQEIKQRLLELENKQKSFDLINEFRNSLYPN